jgi:thioredoxin reductase (NADPH)
VRSRGDRRTDRGDSARQARRGPLPVLFVVDRDPDSLAVLLSDLSRRFGSDFTVVGESSPEAALAALQEMDAAGVQVALLLVDATAADLLVRAHHMHPRAKRVLLVDRDYTSTSPAVREMALGHADFHIVRPWSDDELMHRAMSEYLSSWKKEHEASFELFRIVASEDDSRLPQLRGVMTRLGFRSASIRSRARPEPACSSKPVWTPRACRL